MSFLWNWFSSLFSAIGLDWVTQKSAKVLFLGLDNAGKSTLLNMLKTGNMATLKPTRYATSEEVSVGGCRFHAFDLGGHEAVRVLWEKYMMDTDAVVFLVDAADQPRLEEVRDELSVLLEKCGDERPVPFCILANKMDLPDATDPDALRDYLGLTLTGKQ
ncbi:MAG: hypothetical protein MHM6MM_008076, partial [Cercozoa sp. M6MM]